MRHSYRIREVEPGHSDCGYRIREVGIGAAEITDVWRMRHSFHIREVGSVAGGEP
ncbi:hypothetical protein D3C81_2080780 [compost metagenome]